MINKHVMKEKLVVDQVMTPKDMHLLITSTYEYVNSHGKRDSADVIKLRLLK